MSHLRVSPVAVLKARANLAHVTPHDAPRKLDDASGALRPSRNKTKSAVFQFKAPGRFAQYETTYEA